MSLTVNVNGSPAVIADASGVSLDRTEEIQQPTEHPHSTPSAEGAGAPSLLGGGGAPAVRRPVERPILFSAPMVLALLAGTKTQTRRLAKWVPYEPGLNLRFSGLELGYYNTCVPSSGWVLRSRGAGGCWNDRTKPLFCPYGVPGDRLWVREAWRCDGLPTRPGEVSRLHYRADVGAAHDGFKWKPGIHMFRWASRLTLDVTEVRVQRLQDISEEDARAEGMQFHDGHGTGHTGWRHDVNYGFVEGTARGAFFALWRLINGDDSLKANPWVWCVSFRRVQP